jgi:hypothetical protein
MQVQQQQVKQQQVGAVVPPLLPGAITVERVYRPVAPDFAASSHPLYGARFSLAAAPT